MKYADKYKPMYYPAPAGYNKWIEKDHIEQHLYGVLLTYEMVTRL